MDFETNRKLRILFRKNAIWNVKVRIADEALIYRTVPSAPDKIWNVKVVLN